MNTFVNWFGMWYVLNDKRLQALGAMQGELTLQQVCMGLEPIDGGVTPSKSSQRFHLDLQPNDENIPKYKLTPFTDDE